MMDYEITIRIPFRAGSPSEANVEADGLVETVREILGSDVMAGEVECIGGPESEERNDGI